MFSRVIIFCTVLVCYCAEDQIQETTTAQHPISYISVKAQLYENDKIDKYDLKQPNNEVENQPNRTTTDYPKKDEIIKKNFLVENDEDINTGQNKKDNKEQLVDLLVYHDDNQIKNKKEQNEPQNTILSSEKKITQEINYKDFLTKYTDDTDFNDAYLKYLLQKQTAKQEVNYQVESHQPENVDDTEHTTRNIKDELDDDEGDKKQQKYNNYYTHNKEHKTHQLKDHTLNNHHQTKHENYLHINKGVKDYGIHYDNGHDKTQTQSDEGVEYLRYLKENADKAIHYITKHYYEQLQNHQNQQNDRNEVYSEYDYRLPNPQYQDYYANDIGNTQYVDYQIMHEIKPEKFQENILDAPSDIKSNEHNEFQEAYDTDDDDNYGYGKYGIDIKKLFEDAKINDEKLEKDFNRETNEIFDVNLGDNSETQLFKENELLGSEDIVIKAKDNVLTESEDIIINPNEVKDLAAEELRLNQESKLDPQQYFMNGHANVQNTLGNANTTSDVRNKRKSYDNERNTKRTRQNVAKQSEEENASNQIKQRGRKRIIYTKVNNDNNIDVINLKNSTKDASLVGTTRYGKKLNGEDIYKSNDNNGFDNIFTTQPTKIRQRGQPRPLGLRLQSTPEPNLVSNNQKQEDRYVQRVNARRPVNNTNTKKNNQSSRESAEIKDDRKVPEKKPRNQRGRIRYTSILSDAIATTTSTTTTNRPIKPIKPAKVQELSTNVLVENYYQAKTYRPEEGIINPYSGFTIPQYGRSETTDSTYLKELETKDKI